MSQVETSMNCSTCFSSVRYAYASSELRISGSLTISISGVPLRFRST